MTPNVFAAPMAKTLEIDVLNQKQYATPRFFVSSS